MITSPLPDLIENRRVLVCVGAGGVGKTTVSASLGVAAARMGKRTLVLTVDPARRLANALGLSAFDEHVQTIAAERLQPRPGVVGRPLDAAMLDVKSTFDRVVRRYSSSEEHFQAIVDNPFYKQASTALAGSQEYMAMERLYELATEEPYDLIVLDTPPSAHALDFLDAPYRMIELFDSAAFRLLLRSVSRSQPNGTGLFGRDSLLMRGLGRFTGVEMFHGLLAFFATLSATFDGFVDRARNVIALMHSTQTAFVVVSACDEASIHEGLFLHKRLRDEQMQLGAWVLNRVRPYSARPFEAGDGLDAVLASALAHTAAADEERALVEPTARHLAAVSRELARMAAQDQDLLRRLEKRLLDDPPVVAVPRTRDEPATIEELCRLADILMDGAPR